MTYRDLWREHPGKVCICRPFLRDLKTRRVLSWHCIETATTIEAAKAALERLDLEGVTDAVPISTTEKMSIDGDLAARYFRVFFGVRQQASGVV